MKLTIDFETRSNVDLKTCGLGVYAEGKHTDVLILGVKIDDQPTRVWVGPNFRDLMATEINDEELETLIDTAEEIEAHNFAFEKALWDSVMVKQYGFKPFPIEKASCSAAKVAALAFPRSLADLGEALNLTIQKDKKGHLTMLRMCKPKKKGTLIWNEGREDFMNLVSYCRQDCDSEKNITPAVVPLSKKEKEIWILDQKVNARGIKVDLESIDKLIGHINAKEASLLNNIAVITGGLVKSPRQIAASIKWLSDNGVVTETLDKEAVLKILERKDLSPKVVTFLETRQMLGKSSVTKLETMKDMACRDGCVRHTLLYCGCSTGRFSAKGLQVHNYPRDSFTEEQIDELISLDLETIETLYDNIFYVASKCLRGMMIADEGKEFMVADYSAIEARIVAWLAGQENIVTAFREGVDVYKLTAADIFGKKYEEISKQERQIGKVAVLSLGYQGWISAFGAMAKNYGITISEDKAKEIITAWREANQNIVLFWRKMEQCAIQAIKTGTPQVYGKVKFGVRQEPFRALHIRLPSGRLLTYSNPVVVEKTDPYGRTKQVVSYMGVDSTSKKWCPQYTYGGSLTENIVQAVARDLLCEAMLRLDKAGYNVVMHVHDEIICEEVKGEKDLKTYEKLISEIPEWADGLALSAEGWKGRRYRK